MGLARRTQMYRKNYEKVCFLCGVNFSSTCFDRKYCDKCRSNKYKQKPLSKVLNNDKKFNKIQIATLQQVLSQNKTCPGCGHAFNFEDDYALLMIFQRCHIHARGCLSRLKQEVFYACQRCNYAQFNYCGYWESPGVFIYTCRDI